MTSHSRRAALFVRSAAALAIGVGGVALGTLGTAHAAELFTSVSGEYSPGSELTITFPCGDPLLRAGTVWIEKQGSEFAITTLPATVDPAAFTIKLTIPADFAVGASISLFGKCEDEGTQDVLYFGLGQSITLEESSAGGLEQTPTGANTWPMLAIAAGLVVGGAALLPRRRSATREG